jgi:hypothetical protein
VPDLIVDGANARAKDSGGPKPPNGPRKLAVRAWSDHIFLNFLQFVVDV